MTQATAPSSAALPSDAQVLGAVNRAAAPQDVVVCAAGGLPGELHKLWRCREAGTYHVEYGMLVGLIAVICVVAVTNLGTEISTAFSNIASALSGI